GSRSRASRGLRRKPALMRLFASAVLPARRFHPASDARASARRNTRRFCCPDEADGGGRPGSRPGERALTTLRGYWQLTLASALRASVGGASRPASTTS